jgi:hypothetical protein
MYVSVNLPSQQLIENQYFHKRLSSNGLKPLGNSAAHRPTNRNAIPRQRPERQGVQNDIPKNETIKIIKKGISL